MESRDEPPINPYASPRPPENESAEEVIAYASNHSQLFGELALLSLVIAVFALAVLPVFSNWFSLTLMLLGIAFLAAIIALTAGIYRRERRTIIMASVSLFFQVSIGLLMAAVW